MKTHDGDKPNVDPNSPDPAPGTGVITTISEMEEDYTKLENVARVLNKYKNQLTSRRNLEYAF